MEKKQAILVPMIALRGMSIFPGMAISFPAGRQKSLDALQAAEENGKDITIRLYLSNDDNVEIWFDKENEYYTWSAASFGYEDTYAIVRDIFKWLEENSLSVVGIEAI